MSNLRVEAMVIGYLEEICLMLSDGSSDEAIANCLCAIETERMGLGASTRARLLAVVARLRDLGQDR